MHNEKPKPEPQHHAAPTCDSSEWMRFQNLLWDAINRYATSCGGDPSDRVYGNTSRQQAVASVNDAVRDFVCLPDTTTPHKRPCGECHLRPGERCDICGALRCDTAGCENAAVKALCRPHLIGTTTPDVQAQVGAAWLAGFKAGKDFDRGTVKATIDDGARIPRPEKMHE